MRTKNININGVILKPVVQSGCNGCHFYRGWCTKPKGLADMECVDASGDVVKSIIFKLIEN